MEVAAAIRVPRIDGRIFFHVGDGKTRQLMLWVKAGHVNVSHVRDLRGVLDRESADMGVLICLAWLLNYEAGAVGGRLAQSRVFPYTIGFPAG